MVACRTNIICQGRGWGVMNFVMVHFIRTLFDQIADRFGESHHSKLEKRLLSCFLGLAGSFVFLVCCFFQRLRVNSKKKNFLCHLTNLLFPRSVFCFVYKTAGYHVSFALWLSLKIKCFTFIEVYSKRGCFTLMPSLKKRRVKFE